MDQEKRKAPRKTILMQGALNFGGHGGQHKCILHSISPRGAKISLGLPTLAPERFDLQVVGGESHACRRVWQHDTTIGVEFLDGQNTSDSDTDTDRDKAPLDKRRHKRAHTVRRGHIIFSGGFGVMDCLILNTSGSGARIRPTDVLSCPATFKLCIEFGRSYACSVVRRRGDDIAVEFLDLPDAG